MKLNDVAAFVNIVGVMLVVFFAVRWRGRAPRNKVNGNIGLGMIFLAAVAHIALRFSSRW